jgi:hypothetical protein
MRTLVRTAALVESWFDLLPEAQRATARELQAAVLRAEPRLAQTVKWGNLVFMHHGANAIAIVAHRTHASLQFFNGHVLAVQYPQLEGSGKGLRHLKVRYGEPIDIDLVGALARACIEEIDVPR